VNDTTAVAIGAGVAVLALLVWWRSSRAMARRLNASSLRLGDEHTGRDPRRMEPAVSRLERAVEHAVMVAGARETSEARLSQTLRAVPQGVLIFDDEGELVFSNQGADVHLAGPESDALVQSAILEVREKASWGESGRRTFELFGPPRRTLALAYLPLDDGRRFAGALVLVDDVSERRRLEAVRRDFVANISQELRTPVGALGLLAETLLSEDDPAVARRLTQRVAGEAARAGRTIDDLLELCRIEAEEGAVRDAVPVHLVIAEAAERMRKVAERHRITIEVDEADQRLRVVGDRRQLVSALFNLVENAVKYSDGGSTVSLRAATDGTWIDIAVEDHGIGIPNRELERVFERFYRIDRGGNETGGTGIGLAIVRHVASNHHGEVRVESREGEGSTFTLRLPAGPGPGAVTAEAG
jgi:two-component system sensor histidine kinase SenX3